MPSSVSVFFTTTAPGNFTLPHNLGAIPGSVIFEYITGGQVWFQSTRYDANNLYLVASDTGVEFYALIYVSVTPITPSASVPANSTIRLQEVVNDASSLGDVSPALATGGLSQAPALSIANDVMQALINGGPAGQPYNWKWNRFNIPPFPTISLQQDYFIPGLVNLGWLESAWAVNINQTCISKSKNQLEVRKDLQVTNFQTSGGGKICWLPNDQLMTGTWGAAPLGPTAGFPSGQTTVAGPNQTGQQNPGPGVIYTNPLQTLATPINASTCIADQYGNLWALTTYGTCGNTQPAWTQFPTYPTFRNPLATATTVTDGSCVWTAVNPKGQGIRLNPIPPQNGVVWLIQPIGQMRAPRFFNLTQYLNPIPDDFEWAFKQGFFAECYRRNPDAKVRARYPQERQIWLEALDHAVRQSDREMDDYGFYPSSIIMDTGYAINQITPAQPFGPWSGW
jgi:hypothetical protein